MYGLLPAGNEPLIPYAIRMMSATDRQRSGAAFDLAEDFRATFRGTVCKPHFVGVWDTVSSVGWIENPLKLPFSASNPDIDGIFHFPVTSRKTRVEYIRHRKGDGLSSDREERDAVHRIVRPHILAHRICENCPERTGA
jgi:uncharacterized protein (DUF2235 family)